MDLNKFTQKSRQALVVAQQEAVNRGHQVVVDKHLLMALLEQEEGLTLRILQQIGIDPSFFRRELDILLNAGFRF